jgi:hypothetical protein
MRANSSLGIMPTEVGEEQSTVSKVRHEDYKSPTPFAAMKGIAGDVFVALETIRTNSDTINRQFF